MKRLLVVVVLVLFAGQMPLLMPVGNAAVEKPFAIMELSAKTEPGSVTISWPKTSQSTIYVYRDYAIDAKPIATLNPSDTSFTDKTSGGHNYSIMIIGRDGSVAAKSNPLPVWVPDACESSDGTVMKLWVDKNKMVTDCQETTIKTAPTVINNSTFVSIRPIIEAAGGSLQWNSDTKTATVILPPNTVSLTIGNPVAKVNGAGKNISTNPKIVPVIKNGNTMLPFRFIIENLSGTVGWDANERRMDIVLPLQPNKAIARIMSAYSTLARIKLGQLVVVDKVETTNNPNPVQEFLSGAKILFLRDGKPVAMPLMGMTDVDGRKLADTDLKNLYQGLGSNLSAYKVSIKSQNSQLPSFTTVVLVNGDTGDVVDATFLANTLGFSALQQPQTMSSAVNGSINMTLAAYTCSFAKASIAGGKLSFGITSIPFSTSTSGRMTVQTPGCNPCQPGKTDLLVEFRNTCPDALDESAKLHLPIISSMVDFGLNLGQGMDLIVDQGCAFFPSPACPDVTDAQSDMVFEVADFRPINPSDQPRVVSQPVKGSYRLVGSKTGWNPESNNPKSKNYISVKLSDDPKPRSMTIKIGNGSKGSFSLSALPESLYPGNPPRISVRCPLVSSPVGNQVGILKLMSKTSMTISLPFDKVGSWFAPTDRTFGVFSQNDIDTKAEFDCPCNGTGKLIEDPKLDVETKGDLVMVNISCRINTDLAFRRDSDKVEVQLFRNDEPLQIVTVVRSNPNVIVTDADPMAGETYMYCIKALVNQKEADEWCNEEEIVPMPSSFKVTWANRSTLFNTKIMAGDKFYLKVIVTNSSDSELKVSLYLKPPCRAWKCSFVNQALSTVVTVPAGGTNQSAQIAITPDVGLAGGEVCEFVLEAISGKQKQQIKLKATTEAVQCAYLAQWNEGGSAIGGVTSAGVQNVSTFFVKNTGNEINKFIIDLQYDRMGSTSKPVWQLRFGGDYTPGMTLNLKPGEQREIQVFCRSANDMPDGDKLKISVVIDACGEKQILTWLLTNSLSECDFTLEWEKGTGTKTSSTYPSEKFYLYFQVKNNMNAQSLFLITTESKGELIDVSSQYYELQLLEGEEKLLRLTCVTDQKAKIGQSKIYVNVSCGKTKKTIQLSLNVQKQEECAYEIMWDSNRKNEVSSDMPIDEPVYMAVRVRNKSLTEQYFAVKIERSVEQWSSGIPEKSLRQTFTLNPGEEVSNLIIYVKSGDSTKVGDKCTVKVTISACGTAKEIKWLVTCVPHQDLDVNFTGKLSDPTWQNDDRLLVPGLYSFTRQGVGTIKASQYWFEFYDADNFDATLGKLDKLPLDMQIQNGTTLWKYSLRIPAGALSKAMTMNSKTIKVIMYIGFTLEKDKDIKTIEKSITFNVAIPEK
jgi:hypothetical protein